MSNAETFRPRSNYIWMGLVVVFALGFTAESFFSGTPTAIAVTALLMAGLVCLGYMIFIRPQVIVSDEGIEIHNAFTTHVVGWHDVIAIETRYSMSIMMEDRVVFAMAAPAPSRYHARNIHKTELKGLALPDYETLRAGDSPRTHSGVAAHMARLRWQRFQKLELAPSIERSYTTHPWLLLVTAVCWLTAAVVLLVG